MIFILLCVACHTFDSFFNFISFSICHSYECSLSLFCLSVCEIVLFFIKKTIAIYNIPFPVFGWCGNWRIFFLIYDITYERVICSTSFFLSVVYFCVILFVKTVTVFLFPTVLVFEILKRTFFSKILHWNLCVSYFCVVIVVKNIARLLSFQLCWWLKY